MDAKQFRDVTIAAKAAQVTATIPSTANAAVGSVAVAVPGVQLGDLVDVSSVAGVAAGVLLSAYVTAANTVELTALNESGATFNPGSAKYNLLVLRPKTA